MSPSVFRHPFLPISYIHLHSIDTLNVIALYVIFLCSLKDVLHPLFCSVAVCFRCYYSRPLFFDFFIIIFYFICKNICYILCVHRLINKTTPPSACYELELCIFLRHNFQLCAIRRLLLLLYNFEGVAVF